MRRTREKLRKGLACLFALALAVAFVPGLGVLPAPQASADTVLVSNDANYGTVTVTGLDDDVAIGEVTDVTVSITGNAQARIEDVGFDDITISRNSSVEGEYTQLVKVQLSTQGAGVATGTCNLKVNVANNDTGASEWFYYAFKIVPSAPVLTTSNFKTNYNSATIYKGSWGYANGDKVEVYTIENGELKYRAGFLTSDTTDGTVTVKGLKANTSYVFFAIGYSKGIDDYGAMSKRVTVKTGLATAPKVKSLKVSGAKQKYLKRTYHSGHWDAGGIWHEGYYTGGYYVTTYKVKVTLKKKVPGTTGLLIGGTKVYGKGKTFTTSFSTRGKVKGKKRSFSIASYRANSYIGSSRSVTKSAKIK